MAPQQKGFSWSNIAVGATMNMFEVSTLGQPLEVVKTQMGSNRTQTMSQALKTVWSRGGVLGFYQGLIPWVSEVHMGTRWIDQRGGRSGRRPRSIASKDFLS